MYQKINYFGGEEVEALNKNYSYNKYVVRAWQRGMARFLKKYDGGNIEVNYKHYLIFIIV